MSDEELDFHKAWSACAGKLEGLNIANAYLLSTAPRHFMAGKLEMAEEIRRLSVLVNYEIQVTSDELRKFIDASQKPHLVKTK